MTARERRVRRSLIVDDPDTGERAAPATFALGYRPALDGLRAVAIAMVLWHHGVAVLIPRRDLPLGGFLGVDVFFVLSGFLITSLLLEHSSLDRPALGRFYLRRARRLLPALVVFLVVHGIAAAIQGRDLGQEARTSLAALFYVANWARTFGWDLASDQVHLWSLSVEEQFYLLWPPLLAVAFALGRRGRRLVPVLAGVVAAIAAWRLVLVAQLGAGPDVFFRTDARADTILVGALLAAAVHAGWWPSARLRRLAGWMGAAVLAYAFVRAADLMDLIYRGGFTVLALAAAGVILASLDGTWGPGRLLARPVPVLIGRLSYSLYLWHLLCFGLVASLYQGPGPLRLGMALVASLGCAALSYRYVELPWLGRARPPMPVIGRQSRTNPARLVPAGGSAIADPRSPQAPPEATAPARRRPLIGSSLAGGLVLAAGIAIGAAFAAAQEPADAAPAAAEGLDGPKGAPAEDPSPAGPDPVP